jgi:glutamate racemase
MIAAARLRGVNPDSTSRPCIGVFDSGVGGLSVLDALRRRLPDASLVYIGDVAYAPYGERTTAEIIDRCQRIVARLVKFGARIIVVACNTATVLGIAAMRQRWPDLRFVGVEPGVKTAVTATRTKRIAVMATPATAASARLRHLVETFASNVHVHIEPCAGLAAVIERGIHDGPELDAVLSPPCARIRAAQVDTVVLGCTHYPFVVDAIRTQIGSDVQVVDTAAAVAERVAAVRDHDDMSSASLQVWSTGATESMTSLLQRCRALEQASIGRLPI